MTKEDIEYSWANTFEDLIYKSDKRGTKEREFRVCLKCLGALKHFNKKHMLEQAKAYGITLKFELCEEHEWCD